MDSCEIVVYLRVVWVRIEVASAAFFFQCTGGEWDGTGEAALIVK